MRTILLLLALSAVGCAAPSRASREARFIDSREEANFREYEEQRKIAAAESRARTIEALASTNPFGACVMRARDSYGVCAANTATCRNTFDADVITCAAAYGRDVRTAATATETP